MKKIAILKSPEFLQPREYTADDITDLLSKNKLQFDFIDHRNLENISYTDFKILIAPYIEGEFSAKAIESLIAFHSAGGSLFFLGDLPHTGKWYPLRNMFADKFHLTRCYDDVSISADKPGFRGLTDKGKEILGKLHDTNFFKGKRFACLRVTAFPPDITYPLISIESSSHALTSTSIVAIERRCQKFFGAKFAMIGFIGGEPRENVCGACNLKWTYNPGLLTRKWKGINNVVLRLIQWLEPEKSGEFTEKKSVVNSAEKQFMDFPPTGHSETTEYQKNSNFSAVKCSKEDAATPGSTFPGATSNPRLASIIGK